MCIVIDTNVLASVFSKKSANHSEFEPIYNWIYEGRGSIVYGGTKYLAELQKYRRLFTELRIIGKAKFVSSELVDEMESEITSDIQGEDFDDQHIVALLVISKCRLICSLDERAYPYFKHRKYFTKRTQPKIYRRKSNANLLCDANIADFCKPCVVHNKELRQTYPKIL